MKQLLDSLVEKYNTPAFVADDPVQFPHRFTDKRDIEITSLLISTIAWGRRPMILRNSDRLLEILDNEPYDFLMSGDIEAIPDDNIHRTFFGRNLKYFLRGLREIYNKYGTLEDFAVAVGAPDSDAPAWLIARKINEVLCDANTRHPLAGPTRCLPERPETSALKRLNMALRWLVRNDGIVDLGVWTALKPSQLYIPLDVHSAASARSFALLSRRQNDRKAVEELTANLRKFRPDDPTIYDFALFGLGAIGEGDGSLI